MSDVADYDTDILLWSERQAELLRGLKSGVRGLPNDLDLENVAEEIESVGRSEQAAVESFIELILVHALKAASNDQQPLISKWRAETTNFSAQARRRATPAIRLRIDLDDLWQGAVRQAGFSLAEYGDQLVADLPASCPVGMDVLLARDFDFDRMVAGIWPRPATPRRRPPIRRPKR